MTLIRPPGFSNVMASDSDSSAAPNSSLTAIRIAWNTLFAGWPPVLLAAAGMPDFDQLSKFSSGADWALFACSLNFTRYAF